MREAHPWGRLLLLSALLVPRVLCLWVLYDFFLFHVNASVGQYSLGIHIVRHYECGFPVIFRRHAFTADFLILWFLKSLYPLFSCGVPWASDAGVVLRCISCVGSPMTVVLCIFINYGFLLWSLLQSSFSGEDWDPHLLVGMRIHVWNAVRDYAGLVKWQL